MQITLSSPAQTKQLGVKLAALLQPGDFISLTGDLGAGKTLFVKGVGSGLGIAEDEITSPSFTLINEYLGQYPLYHFDVYRLDHADQLEDLGYEDYFFGNGICLVEWGDKVEEYFPASYLELSFTKLSEQSRQISVDAHGARYEKLRQQLSVVVDS